MTFVSDWVFKQGRIAGKVGKRTIFRSWTGIAGKPYILSLKAGNAGQTFLSMKTY